ncbi:hypothetical protein Dimus_024499 [Dionaea muscipula]
MDSGPLPTDGSSEQVDIVRLNHMCQEATRLACRGATYNDFYVAYMETMNGLSDRLDTIITLGMSSRTLAREVSEVVSNNLVQSQSLLLDPNISQTKGIKTDTKGKEVATPSGQIKSGIELAIEKRKRMCKSCGQPARHDPRNCPLNTNRRQRNIDDLSSLEMEEVQLVVDGGWRSRARRWRIEEQSSSSSKMEIEEQLVADEDGDGARRRL